MNQFFEQIKEFRWVDCSVISSVVGTSKVEPDYCEYLIIAGVRSDGSLVIGSASIVATSDVSKIDELFAGDANTLQSLVLGGIGMAKNVLRTSGTNLSGGANTPFMRVLILAVYNVDKNPVRK